MIQNKRIIIVAHYLLYGAAHALADYLKMQNLDRLLCIFLPLASQRNIIYTEYKSSSGKAMKKIAEKNFFRSLNLGPVDYILDILETLWLVYSKGKYQLYVGLDCLNCLTGLFLKKMGKVEKVIFYS